MLAERVRSGVVETFHDGALAVADSGGRLVAWMGDIDRPFYLRSAAKPFQALVAVQSGAMLTPVQLALACASHYGDPVHISIIESMLAAAGVGESALGCPPDWPLGEPARLRAMRDGTLKARRLWNNCSGKHAAWLMAIQASGWPVSGYLNPSHPLQDRVTTTIAELGEHSPLPVGVDGCGAPVFRTTTRVMARLYARLAALPDLRPVYEAMHRYPALVGGVGSCDTGITVAFDAVAKWGARGCLGVAVGESLGIAVKSWDGSKDVSCQAASFALKAVGFDLGGRSDELDELLRPPVYGGGVEVGALESRVDLEFS